MLDRPTLRIRWLGRVPYHEAYQLQRGLFAHGSDDHLLLLEHPHTFTLGRNADPAHVLVDPTEVGAELVATDRGGDVTYHGPGQLVGYPIRWVGGRRPGGIADTVGYVREVEQLLVDLLGGFGLDTGRLEGYPGVWVEPSGLRPRKIAAIGVRLSRGRSMHGFALNVAPDLGWFDRIVPCGIADKAVTSLAAEGVEVELREVVDRVAALAGDRWAPVGADGSRRFERADVAWRHRPEDLSPFSRGGTTEEVPTAEAPVRLRGRLREAGVGAGLPLDARKPPWMRVPLRTVASFRSTAQTLADLELVTVCEEAGCPNRSECWAEGTATFMINGERCTRACGFCLVDTRHPEPLDVDEPRRVAQAVERLHLDFAVLTAVARDDLDDGGASGFAACIAAIRSRCPGTLIEALVPDCKGDAAALDVLVEARPDVFNHNLETVARLQRAVRPSAGYARSLAVLARARSAGLVTKSGLVVGMGESFDEVVGAMADLRAVGVSVLTVGQYLRPTARHLPVSRWWEPEAFGALRREGARLGFDHVEADPLTRSSHHARAAAVAAGVVDRVSVAPAVATGWGG